MFLTLTIEANITTHAFWKQLCDAVPNTTLTLVRMTFGFNPDAPIKPTTFYDERIYGFHPNYLKRLRIQDITVIPHNDADYIKFISIKKPTSAPDHRDPIIFSLFIITFPIEFTQSHGIIQETPFPAISSHDRNKKSLFFWQPTLERIVKKSDRRMTDIWRHCLNVYAYDWIVFFNQDVSTKHKTLHPLQRHYWRRRQYELHNFTFTQMMRLLFRQITNHQCCNRLYLKECIPHYSFIHNHQDLTRKPDKLIQKLIKKYSLNDYMFVE